MHPKEEIADARKLQSMLGGYGDEFTIEQLCHYCMEFSIYEDADWLIVDDSTFAQFAGWLLWMAHWRSTHNER